eukprot:CAMPEP_0194287732 /NCGR_PEP_ID=MMETSP0169-20130528/35377_1 /TAXON_ID=218684 /ORGANISM="Corethron pennatum, Strain L29A3" /LENGTH=408 /DNA_ID=CAMNT_0039034525 /DNA_START=137 /DNA_END=1363 /DNA_ORIENTATION=-
MIDFASRGSKPVNIMQDSSGDEYKKFIETFEFKNDVEDAPILLDLLNATDVAPNSFTILDMLIATNTDAFLVMHKDKIVYERYWNQTASMRHAIWSCTKSFFALTAAMLAHDGKLDPEKLVEEYIPELKDHEAFEGVTVRHIMDMSIAIDFDESKYGPGTDNANFTFLTGTKGARGAIKEYFKLHPDRTHGDAFEYITPVTETLGWILDSILGGNGKGVEYFQDRIWSKLGQEHDFMVMLTTVYTPTVPRFPLYGGGGAATARDMLRFGQMMLGMGKTADGVQIVPREVVKDILVGGTDKNIEQYENSRECQSYGGNCDMAYRNMFRVYPKLGIFEMSGIHGQIVHVDTKNDYVAVKQSSNSNSTQMFSLEYLAILRSKIGLKESIPELKKSKKSKRSKGSKVAKRGY